MATTKKTYVTDKKTGKPLSVDPKKVQEAGVGSVGKMAVKLGVKAVQKVVKSATASNAQKKAYKEKVTIPTKKVVKAAKKEIKVEAKAIKAANKPTKASKTFEGNNNKISVEVRRGVLKREKPANPNVTRGGGMATLKRQDAEAAFRAAKNKALANSAKGKLQTPTAEAARRRNINK